jgi:CPA2 family monovalent cation:H+ antiporter-2
VLVGYGRVGQVVAAGLSRRAAPFVVIDAEAEGVTAARAAGFEALEGNCADHALLAATNIAKAKRLVVAIPDPVEAGAIVEHARSVNPALEIVARAHSDAASDHLTAHGADAVIMGEREIAHGMLGFMAGAPTPSTAPPAAAAPASIVPPPLVGAERLILDDAERAVLDGFRAREMGAGEAISMAAISADAQGMGFAPERLEAAFASLAEKACLDLLGDGRVRLTQAGLVQAVSSRPLA